MWMLGWMCGVIRKTTRNKKRIKSSLGIAPVEDKLKENMLRRFGRVMMTEKVKSQNKWQWTGNVVEDMDKSDKKIYKKMRCHLKHGSGYDGMSKEVSKKDRSPTDVNGKERTRRQRCNEITMAKWVHLRVLIDHLYAYFNCKCGYSANANSSNSNYYTLKCQKTRESSTQICNWCCRRIKPGTDTAVFISCEV